MAEIPADTLLDSRFGFAQHLEGVVSQTQPYRDQHDGPLRFTSEISVHIGSDLYALADSP